MEGLPVLARLGVELRYRGRVEGQRENLGVRLERGRADLPEAPVERDGGVDERDVMLSAA